MLKFLALASIVLISSTATETDPTADEVKQMMEDILTVDKYTVPLIGGSHEVDWAAVRDDFENHMSKLREEIRQAKSGGVAADVNLAYAGSKRKGKYTCSWVAKNFASTCGPRDNAGKYISYSAAKYTLRKYAVIKKGQKKVSFKPACRGHDLCWTRCEKSQKKCDNEFKKDLSNICSSRLRGKKYKSCRAACRSIRDLFVTIVRKSKFLYCDSLEGRTNKFFLMKKKVKGDKIRPHCVELVGTFGGLIKSRRDLQRLAKLMKKKKVATAWIDSASCRKVPCRGVGSCAYVKQVNGRGRIVRTKSCSKKRRIVCDRLMRNGKSPNVAKLKEDDANEYATEENEDVSASRLWRSFAVSRPKSDEVWLNVAMISIGTAAILLTVAAVLYFVRWRARRKLDLQGEAENSPLIAKVQS